MKAALLSIGTQMLCPGPGLNEAVEVSIFNTGWISTSHSRISADGERTVMRIPLLVGHIQHPDGDVFVDAGMGATTRSGTFPRFPLSTDGIDIPNGFTLHERAGSPPETILMTHLHYDHIGGLLDLTTETEVWISAEEWRTARTSNLAFPERKIEETVRIRAVDFGPGAATQQLGVPAVDVRGDGTIWYLSTPGHTPGSASVLVHAADAAWLFIGDIAWIDDHLIDTKRPHWVSVLVDGRPRQQRHALQWARTLKHTCPALNIVAGHEPRWAEQP